jgi:hypothetical protein
MWASPPIDRWRRIRTLPECVSTISEFINTGTPQFKIFGPSGHPALPPIRPTEPLLEEGEMTSRGQPPQRNRNLAKG